MRKLGLFREVSQEIGGIIVAGVNDAAISVLTRGGGKKLSQLIAKDGKLQLEASD